ncbi:MAG: hypothetical protein KDA28_10405 [Phycisphaerales bacterium]|nr:hypothetical protein [Phycisphaerales bacterium]
MIMRNSAKFGFVLILVLGLAACGGAGMVGGMLQNAGLTSGGEEHSITMESMFPSLDQTQRASLDPFGESTGVTYNTYGVSDVDTFVESASCFYANVTVMQSVVTAVDSMVTDPQFNVAGFNDARSVLEVGQGIQGSLGDASALISSGQSIVTNIPSIAAGDPLLVPALTDEVQTALGRLNDSQEMLRSLGPQLMNLASQVTN